jgi:cell division transport system ATP-binding protein
MISFQNVTKRFGSITALEDISFEIKAGEFVFLTGPSGAGKTTVLKLLLRQYLPDSGRVLIEGRDLAELRKKDLPLYRRKIGVVFQDFKLLSDLTVFENVAISFEIGGDKKDLDNKVKEALEKVGMLTRAQLFPRQLSGGELQRTVIARAICMNPKIILADEPTGNLDPETARQIVKLLDEAADRDTTVIMATHNAELVNLLKRRVILLKNGRLVSDKEKGEYER